MKEKRLVLLNGYYADASRMFVIGRTDERRQRLVEVAWECLKVGEKVCSEPYVFVGDLGDAIRRHAHANGCSVVRDLCGTTRELSNCNQILI